MKKVLIYFGDNYKLGYFGGSFLNILRLFLRPRYRMGMFLGITKFLFFWGGGGGGGVGGYA